MAWIEEGGAAIGRGREWLSRSSMGAVRVALLFGSGALALTLVLVPLAERQGQNRAVAFSGSVPGVDLMATGSIGQQGGRTYTIRRSVLQSDPQATCIIEASGTRQGDC